MQLTQCGAAFALVVGLAACGGDPCNAGKSVFTGQWPAACAAATGSTPVAASGLVLRVEGTSAAADVYYVTPAATADAANVPLPWSAALPAATGDSITLLASQATGQTGGITATVTYNGKVLQQSSGSGSSALARVTVTCCGN